MEVNQHRTWAEIDLGAIEHNYRVICEQAQAPVLCVVKADAYGHGAATAGKQMIGTLEGEVFFSYASLESIDGCPASGEWNAPDCLNAAHATKTAVRCMSV